MSRLPKSAADLKTGLPDVTSTFNLKALEGQITIYRDKLGIPHVKALTAHDAFFGQGFVTAQDRLWQMAHDRMWAYGRWAEYAGPSGVGQDTLLRKLRILDSVKADYASANAETRAMVEAYAAGVNAFITTTKALPVELGIVNAAMEPWQPWDSMAVFKVRHILMGFIENKMWRAGLVNVLGPERAAKLIPSYSRGGLLIVPTGAEYAGPSERPAMDAMTTAGNMDAGLAAALEQFTKGAEPIRWMVDPDSGSNCWAVHGSRTASGKPIVAGDPHRPFEAPNPYYQNHIASDEFDALGLSFPGVPGFTHFGHNAHVAFCVTHAAADYQDLYVERFKKGAPDLYEFKREWKKADVRRETIKVRGGKDAVIDVTMTHHGPVFFGDPAKGHGIAFKYTATAEPNTTFQAIRKLICARKCDDANQAMRDWVDPGHNFVTADVHGDITYLTRGRLPIRSMDNAWLPVPGWDGKHEWQGYVPFEEMPYMSNPEQGMIVTANNRIIGEQYRHFISFQYAAEFRGRRIYERLKTIKKATAADMEAVHGERKSMPGERYAKLIRDVKPKSVLALHAKDILKSWEGDMERDSVAPTIYSAFRRSLDLRILKHLLGPLYEEAMAAGGRGAPQHVTQLRGVFSEMAAAGDTTFLPPGTDWKSLMADALEEAVQYLRGKLGDDIDTWTWGRVHVLKPQHKLSVAYPELAPLLDGKPVAIGGDGDTPQNTGHNIMKPFAVASGSIARYVFDTADWDNSRWVVPTGVSGHPGSPHYTDQADTWGRVQTFPALFSWERIAREAESKQVLTV